MAARIKRDDTVLVIRGKDKGRQAKVQRVLTQENMLLIEGVNMVKRHLKAGARGARQGGIIDMEKPLDASKVMLVCPSCGKPTRVSSQLLDDGIKARVCKQCHQMIS